MSQRKHKKPNGQLRQGQVVTTFGPGAMLDLPDHSVLVAGLEHWTGVNEEIVEPRLADKLCMLLNVPSIKLYSPPPDPQDSTAPQNGIGAWQFPEWFIVQDASTTDDGKALRSRMMVHRSALTGTKYIDQDKKRRAVVPIRFVRACRCGHIGDIDWRAFVHSGPSDCKGQLWIDERGTSGDLGEVWIRCSCKTERSMSQAAILQNRALGHCNGHRPWLGPYAKEQCGEPNRLLIRNASNAYFPQLLSVISLPDRDDRIKQAVDSIWDTLEAVENLEQLRYERRKAKVKAALEDLTEEEVLAEIQSRAAGQAEQAKTVKQAELETLITAKPEVGNDQPDGTFLARTLPSEKWQTPQTPWMNAIERVVLVHRLREVVAQVGFTRFDAAAPDIEGELEIGVRRASLSREANQRTKAPRQTLDHSDRCLLCRLFQVIGLLVQMPVVLFDCLGRRMTNEFGDGGDRNLTNQGVSDERVSIAVRHDTRKRRDFFSKSFESAANCIFGPRLPITISKKGTGGIGFQELQCEFSSLWRKIDDSWLSSFSFGFVAEKRPQSLFDINVVGRQSPDFAGARSGFGHRGDEVLEGFITNSVQDCDTLFAGNDSLPSPWPGFRDGRERVFFDVVLLRGPVENSLHDANDFVFGRIGPFCLRKPTVEMKGPQVNDPHVPTLICESNEEVVIPVPRLQFVFVKIQEKVAENDGLEVPAPFNRATKLRNVDLAVKREGLCPVRSKGHLPLTDLKVPSVFRRSEERLWESHCEPSSPGC